MHFLSNPSMNGFLFIGLFDLGCRPFHIPFHAFFVLFCLVALFQMFNSISIFLPYLYLIVVFLTYYVLLEFTKKAKKKRKLERASFCSYSYFGTNHFDARFLLSFYFYALTKYDISSHVFKHVIKCDNFNKIVFGM